MTLSGYLNQTIDVDIRMADALPANAAHTVRFTGPMANPDDASITPTVLSFDNTNWNTPQTIHIIPHRKGTIPIDYDITAVYTARHKLSSFNIHVDDLPLDVFVPTGDFVPPFGLAYMQIGFVYHIAGHAVPTFGGGTGSISIEIVSPSGTWPTGLTSSSPTGLYTIWGTSLLVPSASAGTSDTLHVSDTSGTRDESYTKLSWDTASGSFLLHVGPNSGGPRVVSDSGPVMATNLDGWIVEPIPGTVTFGSGFGGSGSDILTITASPSGGDTQTIDFSGTFNPPSANYTPSVSIAGTAQVRLITPGPTLTGGVYQAVLNCGVGCTITNA